MAPGGSSAPLAVPQDESLVASKKSPWPLWRLSLVALPQLSVQVLWCFIGPNSAPYMLHLGMGPALATLNNVAGPITGFFTGPLVGATSDSLTSPYGRRRPVILVGLIATWVAGMLFASAEHLLPEGKAILFAAPMYWVMDVTINILQTPHRALVADLASDEQQVPMQVVFVCLMAIGNFVAFSIMQIYDVTVEHMFELMLLVCGLNTAAVALQFLVAKETPLARDPDKDGTGACAPVVDVAKAVKGSPKILYHLAFVQCLVWIGLTSWNLYAGQWFGVSVYGGQCKAVLGLVSSLIIILVLLYSKVPPRLVYAPCIFGGAVVGVLAAFFVKRSGFFALVCMTFSVLPEVGSFAIPFGLIAVLNKRAEQEGKQVSTALQMALLNCCITVGQQVCTMTLAAIEGQMSLAQALPVTFMVAAAAQAVGGASALFLDDSVGEAEVGDEEQSSSGAEE
jgi:Na+/melibiose symporter-like transporter